MNFLEEFRPIIRFTRKLLWQFRISKIVGYRGFATYRLAKKNQIVPLKIGNRTIRVRKGTPDLRVAISCLHGEFEILRHLKPAEYEGTIVDAGGYIGTSAIALSELFPKAAIVVIEPSDSNLAILQENIRPYPNIRVVHGALVAGGMETVTLRNRGTGEWGFSVVDSPLDKFDAETVSSVPAITLGSLGVDADKIGILKLDIEGAERDLLLNDSGTLAQIENIFIELHDRIVHGCAKEFFRFSENRVLIKSGGEKYLSIKK